jgi:hypothetical protein
MKYKDFPKHDLRRCLSVLLSIEKLGLKASVHYVSLLLECTRAEVIRSISLAQHQLMMNIVKIGPVYRIDSWGILSREAVLTGLQQFDSSGALSSPMGAVKKGEATMSARETEAQLLKSLVHAVRTKRLPCSNQEADVFRFAAQLLKTRHPNEAGALNSVAKRYFSQHNVKPRPFPQVVSDGLVGDVPRLRHAIENGFSGITTW